MRAFFFAACLLVTATAHAQLGLRVGSSWAGQTTNPFTHLAGGTSLTTSSQLGYQLGLSYRVLLHARWVLVPEVQLSRERQQVHVQGGSNPNLSFQADYHLTSTYVNLPVLVRGQLGRVYFEAGPQASWLVGGRGQGTRQYSGPAAATIFYSPILDQAATASYSRLDAGACLGLGVRVAAGLGLNVRAYQGLVGVNRGDETSTSALSKASGQAYRQSLQLALTYELATR